MEQQQKNWARPYRDSYVHEACKTVTKIFRPEAEIFAKMPHFYTNVFCEKCKKHFPPSKFVWVGTQEQVGS